MTDTEVVNHEEPGQMEVSKKIGTAEVVNHEIPDQVEVPKKKTMRYPYQVFLIVGNEFCERFSYYGMRAVLTIYLTQILPKGSEDLAVVLYHTFISLCYFTPLLGAIIADTLLGKFKTIFFVSIIYASGNIILSLAATPPVHLPQVAFSFVGLALIALGTGGIKPCVSSLGGDQFELPQQEKQLKQFFSVFYFSINAGSLISMILTPEFRNMSCFGMDTCFSLAFGTPAIAMIVALALFLIGSPLYKKNPPQGNAILDVGRCIAHALRHKGSSAERKKHWLDYADDRFSKGFIEDVKIVLTVLVLYIPLPVFWALYDQQGSRWTLQAVQMNGRLGSFVILPDQMQTVNALFILLFIPLFEFGVYPLFARCNVLDKALQRMGTGGFLAAVAFIVAGLLEMKLEAIAPVLPGNGEATLTMLNSLPCNVTINNVDLHPWGTLTTQHIPTDNDTIGAPYIISVVVSKCKALGWTSSKSTDATLRAFEGKAHSILFFADKDKIMTKQIFPEDQLSKSTASSNGYPNVRLIYNLPGILENYTLQIKDEDHAYDYEVTDDFVGGTEYQYIYPRSDYRIHLGSSNNETMITDTFSVDFGGSYSLYVARDPTTKELVTHLWTLTDPNSISILWQLPQYFVITAAEILFSITGLEFSFSQAPVSMKSLMSSAFLLTTAFGDLIDVIIIEIHFFDQMSKESFLFAGLMAADMVLFMCIAYNYTYRDPNNDLKQQPDDASQMDLAMKEKGENNPAFRDDESDSKITEL